LKYWIGDRFASNTLGLSRNLPVSDNKSPILTIPLVNKCFST